MSLVCQEQNLSFWLKHEVLPVIQQVYLYTPQIKELPSQDAASSVFMHAPNSTAGKYVIRMTNSHHLQRLDEKVSESTDGPEEFLQRQLSSIFTQVDGQLAPLLLDLSESLSQSTTGLQIFLWRSTFEGEAADGKRKKGSTLT